MAEQIGSDDLFDDSFFYDAEFDPSSILPISSPVNNQSPLSFDDIAQILLNDDDQVPNGDALNSLQDDFFHDILLDSPLEGEKSVGEVVDLSDDGDNSVEKVEQKKNEAVLDHNSEKENCDDENDDPLHKKRKRELRNKDAALRSRERKKMYVKDLEMKSRYYEGECRRLGSLLQCFMAENQALRFSLHNNSSNTFNASLTKQESAVLFLESLLLGSLLWLISMVMLVVLPNKESQLSQLATNVVEEKPNLVARNRPKTLFLGKRFKASRSRMRSSLHFPLQNVRNILLPVF